MKNTGTTQCDHVAWSPGGSLLGFTDDNDKTTTITILTSTASIICYVPQKSWDSLYEHQKPKKSHDENPLGGLLKPIRSELETAKGLEKQLGIDFRILNIRFRALRLRSDLFKSMLPAVEDGLVEISKSVVDGQHHGNSDFVVKESLPRQGRKAPELASDFRYSAVWQPPLGKDTTKASVWVWETGRQGQGSSEDKSPVALFDLFNDGEPHNLLDTCA